jgi:hypothetical protein
MKHLMIEVPIYKTGVEFYFGKMEDMDKICTKRSLTKASRTAEGTTWLREGCRPLIWIGHTKVNMKSIPITIHEIIHASMHILDFVGIKVSDDNDEPLTYLAQHLLEKVMKIK